MNNNLCSRKVKHISANVVPELAEILPIFAEKIPIFTFSLPRHSQISIFALYLHVGNEKSL